MEFDFKNYSTTQIFIDSSTRSSGSNENFTQIVKPEIQNAMAYRIENVSLPHTYLNMYPSSTALNFSVSTALDGGVAMQISNQSYDIDALISALNGRLGTFTSGGASLSKLNGKILLTIPVGNAFTVSQGDIDQAFSVWPFLGFTIPFGPQIIAARGNNFYNVSGPPRVYIACRALSTNKAYLVTDSSVGQLENTPNIVGFNVNGNSGEFMINEVPSSWLPISAPRLSRLDFKLIYFDGTVIDLQGIPWSMSISIVSSKSF